ncbi:4-hydroxy-tetrahydrodipicolinate synthase [Cohnella sp. CBP 2801]|uniref:4-hydroxy-tetrahydrodipicolinate synthase n=2 Tax=Cohnella zeiphila TaxID=2761120 RepID=A0A7X0VW78_9BACL|nr:4-hydroxy-tetrahydrodipicolinate synthase [Cohnella zeiphila]
MLKPEGIIPAMVTPFADDYSVNETAVRSLVRRLLEAGAHGLFCLGSNGEFFSLTREEKLRLAEVVVDEVGGRVPVYFGSGGISTQETIGLTREFERIGVSAVSVITPYFLKLTQRELAEHYKRLADATTLPILLYNIPNLTGNSLLPKTVAELSRIDNIVAVKDSSGSLDNILQYIEESEPGFSVLAGTDSLILATLMAGGHGGIAATANFMPQTVVAIYEKWKKGELAEAQEEQMKLKELRGAFKLGTLPSALKAALNLAGVPAGPARPPVAPLSPEAERELKKVVRHYIDEGIVAEG